ncbi:APC family permease [Streptomyces sp.]|uniref:APC family permease n=1 Tax=Streptomyces sp. TaxID=1931 RepID=UPI002F42C5C7
MTADSRTANGLEPISPDTSQTPPAARPGLKKNAISLPGATSMGIAFIAPAAGMAFLPQIVASHAGAAVPFVYLMALVGCLCIAYTIAQFARAVSSAGSFYAFNSRGLGSRAGFFSGWLLLIGYLTAFPQNMLAFGYSLSSVLRLHAGLNVPWWVFTGLATVLITGIAIRGLGLSVRVDLAMIGIEVAVLLGLAVVIVARGGAEGNTAAVFTPAASGHVSSGLLFGLVFAFLTMIGFESAATVAEETRDARRNIPRAMIGAVAVTGVFFLFITYAITIGYGRHHADKLAATPLPLDDLAQRYIGSGYAVLVDIAVIVSAFAVSLAAGNGLVRVIFAMSRDRLLPARLSKVDSRRNTPAVAITVVGTVSLVIEFALGGAFGPYPQAYSYLGAVGGLPVILLYTMVGVSLLVYMWRERREEFHPVRHVMIPLAGSAVALTAIYGSYHPLPAGAFLWLNLGFVAYAVVGIVLAAWLRRRHPSMMNRLGTAAVE